MKNSSRFLTAFTTIEKYLRGKAQLTPETPFARVLLALVESEQLNPVYEYELREFAQLRNAIVHDQRGGVVIAEPTGWAVQQINILKKLILDPPTVGEFFGRDVFTASANDNISS